MATSVLNFCFAACRGCEFHKGWGSLKPQGCTRAHTIHVAIASALLSPCTSTHQHKGWQGDQLERATRAFYLLGP